MNQSAAAEVEAVDFDLSVLAGANEPDSASLLGPLQISLQWGANVWSTEFK
jgi:hypothetical protein